MLGSRCDGREYNESCRERCQLGFWGLLSGQQGHSHTGTLAGNWLLQAPWLLPESPSSSE